MEHPKPKRGDFNSSGMIYWDTVTKGERWITPEKFQSWSNKKSARMKSYNQREERIEKSKIIRKRFNQKNPMAKSLYDKNNRLKNKEAHDKRKKIWYYKNPEKVKAAIARSRSTKEKRRIIYEKAVSNPIAKMRMAIRNRCAHVIKNNGWKKDSRTLKYLGCDWAHARLHLENQFKNGMSWENHGVFGWHIDHIVPLASAKTLEDLIPLFHYTNLQPLWAVENMKKSSKLPQFCLIDA